MCRANPVANVCFQTLLISPNQFPSVLALSLSLHYKDDYCAYGIITEMQRVYPGVIAAWKFSNSQLRSECVNKYMPLKCTFGKYSRKIGKGVRKYRSRWNRLILRIT